MCVFDTFGTVADWRASVIAEVEQLAREKGWDLDAVAFAEAWRANYGRPVTESARVSFHGQSSTTYIA